MTIYQSRGNFPQKKHITYYKDDKKSLYWEELFSTKGFSGIYSTKYHCGSPTKLLDVQREYSIEQSPWEESVLQPLHFHTDELITGGDFLTSRQPYLYNNDVTISTAKITENSNYFYKNAMAHELIFIHHGHGHYNSEYGSLPVKEGDYVVIPKGVIGNFHFEDLSNVKLLITESSTPYEIPNHYRNDYGQILEHAPYSERDFKAPNFVDPIDESGEYILRVKNGSEILKYTIATHPYDLVGWDGYLYPYTFNINDFAPITGKIHLPPASHLVFTTTSFVVCNFVPRLYDYHPEAIPAPYFHSNIDSDEVLYYVSGDFMSRRGITEGSITLHPMGIPHGPQPGKIEESIGKESVNELAVMIDTFAPLQATENVKNSMDKSYLKSWL